MLRKNVKIAILYNAFVLAYTLVTELIYGFSIGDHTGQELIGIPLFLFLLTMVHCGILLALFFKTRKERFATYFINMFAVVGINCITVFVDVLLIILAAALYHRASFR